MTMSDQIAVMNDGQIEQVGSPEQVYRVPENTFVAQFIGSPEINLLDASIVDISEDHAVVDIDDGPTVSFDVGEYLPNKASDDVKIGFRPRKLEALTDPNAEGIQTRVDLHEPLGDEVHMYLEGPQGEMRAVVPVDEKIPAGSTATIRPEVPTLYLFNDTTGERFARGDPDSTENVSVEST